MGFDDDDGVLLICTSECRRECMSSLLLSLFRTAYFLNSFQSLPGFWDWRIVRKIYRFLCFY